MKRMIQLGYLIVTLGIIAIAVGGAFIGLGTWRSQMLAEAMQQEQITLGIEGDGLSAGEIIDSAAKAEAAGDLVREHRHAIAPTYGDLLGDGRFDPENPEHLTYGQALNLENYLYLAVMGFGMTQIATGTGAFMILTGTAITAAGLILLRMIKNRG